MFEAHGAVMLIIDPEQGRILAGNQAACAFYGYAAERLAGMQLTQINPAAPEVLARELQTVRTQKHGHFLFRHRLTSGEERDVEIFCSRVEIEGQTLLFSIVHDISGRRHAERALLRSEQQLRDVQQAANLGFYFYDSLHDCWTSSEMFDNIFGIDADFPRDGEHLLALIAPDAQAAMRACLQGQNHGGPSFDHEYQIRRPRDGQHRWVHDQGQWQTDEQGRTVGVLGTVLDITERRQAQQQLHLAASVFSHAREGIMITAADGAIIDVNQAFTRITGYPRAEVLGQNPRLLSSGLQGPEFYACMWQSLQEKGHWHSEIWNRRKNGEIFAEMQTISCVRDSQGNVQQYVALFSDITRYKEHERQMERIAHYDALTTLPNRVLLADRLQQAMAEALRYGWKLAVAYLDLDGFKAVNDLHGHEAGDRLLTRVAAKMKLALRESDTLARLGGDEFVAVLLDLEDHELSLPMLDRLLYAASQPVAIDGTLLQVSASIGLTFYPQTEPVDADQLLRQADQAMYQAKLGGKNCVRLFDAEQDRSIRSHNQSLERIRHALEQHQFVLYYQPKVNMRSGAVIGTEALIRWQHPQHGLLAPARFLPVIENHALAIEIGDWVLNEALTQIETWRAAGLSLPVSVNVGARQLQQPDFVARLRQIMAAHPQVRAGDLELEVLETSALDDVAQVSCIIESCRELGVTFALDDFGTGYSSLTYLKRLAVTQLKIDQSFVRDMLDDPDDLAILEGVLGLASAFRRQVIAEGVETVAHGELLLQLGCELAQGYGIAWPMPAQDFPEWLTHWKPDPAWVDLPVLASDDMPLLFAGVEHRAWMAAIEHYLATPDSVTPVTERGHSRFCQWLQGHGLRRFGADPVFKCVETLHQQVYELARTVCARQETDHQASYHQLRFLSASLQLQLRLLLANLRSAAA
jgi:diguanylate cyclase (GGDEF)-like protein/PAS domain S-box-containing protein